MGEALAVHGEFFAIPTSTLRVNEVVGFDLYLPHTGSERPVLYRERSLEFDEETRARLAAADVAELCVHESQEREFHAYVELHLKDIVRDASVPLEEKSRVMYTSAQHLVKDALADPRAGDVLPRSGAVVEAMVTHMVQEPRAFASLMQITSYDYYTYTHSVNVCVFSLALARRAGVCMDEEELNRFGLGALLHDIGKSRIDASILNERGKLSPSQWAAMRKHPVYGHEILTDQGMTDPLGLTVTRHHHEKLGGTGYPDKLGADEIQPLVRITTIADIFDALTTRRSYKNALNSFPALKLMQKELAKDLDKEYFRLFVEMLGNPEGATPAPSVQ